MGALANGMPRKAADAAGVPWSRHDPRTGPETVCTMGDSITTREYRHECDEKCRTYGHFVSYLPPTMHEETW